MRASLERMCLPALGLILCLGAFSAAPAAHAHAAVLAIYDQPPVPPRPEAGKPETDSEEAQIQKFRHSATVEWFSKVLHTDVETTASLFEYINFAVILLAIGIPLARILPRTFRQRSARLSADIETAQAMTTDANARLGVVEQKLAGLDAEIAAIRKQVEEDMQADEARSKAAIAEEAARIVAAAELEIVQAGTQAQRGLRQFAAELAVERALSQLTLDANADRALFAEFAADVAGKGGKN